MKTARVFALFSACALLLTVHVTEPFAQSNPGAGSAAPSSVQNPPAKEWNQWGSWAAKMTMSGERAALPEGNAGHLRPSQAEIRNGNTPGAAVSGSFSNNVSSTPRTFSVTPPPTPVGTPNPPPVNPVGQNQQNIFRPATGNFGLAGSGSGQAGGNWGAVGPSSGQAGGSGGFVGSSSGTPNGVAGRIR